MGHTSKFKSNLVYIGVKSDTKIIENQELSARVGQADLAIQSKPSGFC